MNVVSDAPAGPAPFLVHEIENPCFFEGKR